MMPDFAGGGFFSARGRVQTPLQDRVQFVVIVQRTRGADLCEFGHGKVAELELHPDVVGG